MKNYELLKSLYYTWNFVRLHRTDRIQTQECIKLHILQPGVKINDAQAYCCDVLLQRILLPTFVKQ